MDFLTRYRSKAEQAAALRNFRAALGLPNSDTPKPEPTPFTPNTIISWGKPPEGFYNPTELIVEPHKYRVIAHANPAQVICPIHVK